MKRFKRGQKGFTLVELLIVVAILGILAAVVIPNVVGLMGRGGAQAYETDSKVIQLAASTFYSDVHSGWNDVSNNDVVGTASTYTDNTWGANQTDEDAGHYYPTAIARVNGHYLRPGTVPDVNRVNNLQLTSDGATPATDEEVAAAAMWMGLLVEAPGETIVDNAVGLTTRGTVSVLLAETGLYLQEMPKSAMATDDRNGAKEPGGGYCWVVGKNGTVYGCYSLGPDLWYIGFSGAYP